MVLSGTATWRPAGIAGDVACLPSTATAGQLDQRAYGLSGPISVPQRGTGAAALTGVLTGNGTSAMTAATSSTVGQVTACHWGRAFVFGALDLADTDAITGDLPMPTLTPPSAASKLFGPWGCHRRLAGSDLGQWPPAWPGARLAVRRAAIQALTGATNQGAMYATAATTQLPRLGGLC